MVQEKCSKMTINNKFNFEITLRSLARVLAHIKPTPWEKVSALIKCPSFGQINENRFY